MNFEGVLCLSPRSLVRSHRRLSISSFACAGMQFPRGIHVGFGECEHDTWQL